MELKSVNGMALKLEIAGYEFPERETEEYDSNWLMISIDVTHPNGNWSVANPCLLTYEVTYLADWLEGILDGKEIDRGIGFLEPSLEFDLSGLDETVNKNLRVTFHMELRPPWAEQRYDDGKAWVEFPLAEIDLRKASVQLREELKQFPQRARN